jgi:hypothetical protein
MQTQSENFLMPAPVHADTPQSRQEARLNLAAEILHRFGEVRFVAHGSSMIPSIFPGDLLTVRSDSVATARNGEIVLFLLGGHFFVHRVLRKWPERNRVVFATRGDALTQEDPSVDSTQLLGRVTSILRRGKPVKFSNRFSTWMKVVRWGVQNSAAFAKTLLAVHQLRGRILGRRAEQSAGSSSKQLQEYA